MRLVHLAPLAAVAVSVALRMPNAQPPLPPAPSDLPLVELPPTNVAHAPTAGDSTLVVFITGDGDWAELDAGVSDALRRSGMGVVGLKARSYLQGHDRSPDGTARDVERIVRHYAAAWQRPRVVLLGYSRGADMLPFVATRLAPDVRSRVTLLGMYGLARAASFKFYWSDMVTDKQRPTDLPVAPELARLRGMSMFCVYGADETDTACRDADPALIQRVGKGGGHHFDKDYASLGALVVKGIGGH